MAGSELETPVVGEIVMTELVADLVVSPKSELVRLLGDILAPQQRRQRTTEMRAALGAAPERRCHAWLWAYVHNINGWRLFYVISDRFAAQDGFFHEQKRTSEPKVPSSRLRGRRAGPRWAPFIVGGRPAPRTRPRHAALTPTEVMLHLQGGSDQQKLEPNTVFIHVKTEEESSPMQERRLPPAVAARQQ